MEKINFEEAICKLEDEVRKLESGNMTLEDSIKSFEESVKLVRTCNEILDSAERRVRILVEAEDGTISDAPFGEMDEA